MNVYEHVKVLTLSWTFDSSKPALVTDGKTLSRVSLYGLLHHWPPENLELGTLGFSISEVNYLTGPPRLQHILT